MADSKNKALPAGTVLRGTVYTYTIEKVLGQGSFGITYLASTLIEGPLGELSMPVAVKEFFAKDLDSRGEDGAVTSRTSDGVAFRYSKAFQRESLNLSKMKHPGIVKVLEAFQANGTYYYSMEYLSGGSLDDKVKGEGIPEEEALPMLKKIGEALAFMHGRKMMHLDLKPKNIMLKADGTPVIIDFGISKQFDDNGEPESSTSIGLGSPGYAPIEQATQTMSGEFQPTLDIYALGATLYKMLTGKTPPAATLVLNKKATLAPDLQAKNVSSGTIDAIRKAMAPLMDDRPKSVQEFIHLFPTSFYVDDTEIKVVGDETGIEDDQPYFQKKAHEAEIRRKAEEKARQEAELRAQEAERRRLAEEKAREEEKRRVAEERERLEAKRMAEEKARQEAELRAQAAEKRRIAEEKARQEAERLAQEAERRRLAEEKAREEEKRRVAEERERLEAKRMAEEKARQEAELRAQAAEKRRIAEEKVRLEAERIAEEAEKRRIAEEKARQETERLAQEAEKRRIAEKKVREEEKRRIAEEMARQEAERKKQERARIEAERKQNKERRLQATDARKERNRQRIKTVLASKTTKTALLSVSVVAVCSVVLFLLIGIGGRVNHNKAEARQARIFSTADTVVMINGIPYPMVLVPSGTFEMGESNIKHRVKLDSYYIGTIEVTQRLWSSVFSNNPSHIVGEDLPVDYLSYSHCVEFIKQINNRFGFGFSLPTEAQWEYAAIGGAKSKGYTYSGADDIEQVAWYLNNSEKRIRPVASKLPNELGIFDMTGNVREWCADYFGDYPNIEVSNPKGPKKGDYLCLRGGDVSSSLDQSYVTRRSWGKKSSRAYTGFRLVLDAPNTGVSSSTPKNATTATKKRDTDQVVYSFRYSQYSLNCGQSQAFFNEINGDKNSILSYNWEVGNANVIGVDATGELGYVSAKSVGTSTLSVTLTIKNRAKPVKLTTILNVFPSVLEDSSPVNTPGSPDDSV